MQKAETEGNFIEEKVLECLCFEYHWNLDNTDNYHSFIMSQDMF